MQEYEQSSTQIYESTFEKYVQISQKEDFLREVQKKETQSDLPAQDFSSLLKKLSTQNPFLERLEVKRLLQESS